MKKSPLKSMGKNLLFLGILFATIYLNAHDLQRPLGYGETKLKLFHDTGAGTTSISIAMHITGPIKKETFLHALQLLYQRHPLLRARIDKNASGTFDFHCDMEFSTIPIRFIQRSNSKQWRKVLEQENNRMFPNATYLWRVTLLSDDKKNEHDLICCFHHAIADGLSTTYLIDDLCSFYARLIQGENVQITSLPLLPDHENMLNEQLLPSPDKIQNRYDINVSPYAFEQTCPIQNRTTKNIYRELSAEELAHLKTRCRQEQTTINSALGAAMFLAAHRQQNKAKSISMLTGINLRPYCSGPIPLKCCGNFAASAPTKHADTDMRLLFWQCARLYQQKLKQSIPPFNVPLDPDMMMQYFGLSPDKKDKNNTFNADLFLSNLGSIPFRDTYGPLRLTSFYFCANENYGYCAFQMFVTSMNKTMFCCFPYTEPLISATLVEAYADTVMDILKTHI